MNIGLVNQIIKREWMHSESIYISNIEGETIKGAMKHIDEMNTTDETKPHIVFLHIRSKNAEDQATLIKLSSIIYKKTFTKCSIYITSQQSKPL